MKISSASKKVLASALSAAMVVAFAPAVALATTPSDPSAVVKTSEASDADMAARGYVAKKYTHVNASSSIPAYDGYEYYKADILGTIGEGTLIADITVDGSEQDTIILGTGTVLDMANHKITASEANVNAIKATGALTLKNGTVEATGKGATAIVDGTADSSDAVKLTNVNVNGKAKAISGNNNVTIDGGTTGTTYTDIEAASVTAKGTVTTGAITGDVTAAKNAVLTVATENAAAHAMGDTCHPGHAGAAAVARANAATGIGGKLTVAEGSNVTVTAISKAGVATGIGGGIAEDVNGAKNAAVTVTAKSIANARDAYAVNGSVTLDDQGAALSASAVSAANAYGIYSNMDTTDAVTLAAGTVTADGNGDANSFAIYLSDGPTTGKVTLTGGTYTGKIVATAKNATTPADGSQIKAGKYSVNPTDYVLTANYDVSKGADGLYLVQQFQDFAITGTGSATTDDVINYVKAATQAMVKGQTPAGIKLAEGVTAEQFVAQAAKGLKVNVKINTYNEKNATDEQKAAKATLDETIKANLSKADAAAFKTITITIEYDKTGVVEPVVMATVTSLGEIPNGLNNKQAVLQIGDGTGVNPEGACYAVTSGSAAKVDWKKNVDGQNVSAIEFATIPTLFAYTTIDQEAVKNAAEKGEQAAETITDPAVLEAITALQDEAAVANVSGKSKVIKKGKAGSVSLKVAASKSGAAVTFKKANKAGGAKITVSKAGKVTAKKALKKGTYKVKVKATCGSATKTVTVKIVKK